MAFNTLLKEREQSQGYISRSSSGGQLVKRKLTGGLGGFGIVNPDSGNSALSLYGTPDNLTARLTELQRCRRKLRQNRLSSRLNDPFVIINVGEGAPAIYPSTSYKFRSWSQLGEALAQRMLSASPLPLATEFNPSDDLARFLARGSGENQLTLVEAKKQLKRFVRSFIGTIADSLGDRQLSRVQLTENGQFRENVARALLHRFPVGVYEQGDFLTILLEEITPVAKGGQFGTASGVLTEDYDELFVKPTGHKAPPLLSDVHWVKATTPVN